MTSSHTPNPNLYRERLLQARAQLLQRMAQQRGGLVSRAEMAAEHDVRASDDRAQATTELNEEFAMNEHETAELGAIDAALDRITQGLYGLCTDCGADITPARLSAWPMALRCIDCQTLAEKSH